jgi:hypothetical protein
LTVLLIDPEDGSSRNHEETCITLHDITFQGTAFIVTSENTKSHVIPLVWPQYWDLYEPRGPAKGPNGG